MMAKLIVIRPAFEWYQCVFDDINFIPFIPNRCADYAFVSTAYVIHIVITSDASMKEIA